MALDQRRLLIVPGANYNNPVKYGAIAAISITPITMTGISIAPIWIELR